MLNVMQRIELNAENYTNAEKKVYKLVVEKPHLIEKYTIVKIADFSGVSKSAVLRFCQRLGYRGYSEFRYDMVTYLHHESMHPKNTATIPSQIAERYAQALNSLRSIDVPILEAFIADIKKADYIHTFGLYNSGIVAQYFKNTFQNYGKIVLVSEEEISINRAAFTLTDKSLVVDFSISGSKGYATSFFKETEKIGYSSYLITCNPNAYTKKYVDKTILLPAIAPMNQNTLNEHALVMVFIEILGYMYVSN